MSKYYVYGYFEPGAENPFYIGKGSRDSDTRHLCDSVLYKSETHLYKKLRKMLSIGTHPVIRRLEIGLSEEEAFDVEIKFIKQYGRQDNGTGCLTNHTNGGPGPSGLKYPKDRVELRRSRARSENERINQSSRQSGLKMANTVNMSLSNIRLWASSEYRIKTVAGIRRVHAKPVECYNLVTGETLKRFSAMADTEKDGFNPAKVGIVCNGHRPHHKHLGWRYSL